MSLGTPVGAGGKGPRPQGLEAGWRTHVRPSVHTTRSCREETPASGRLPRTDPGGRRFCVAASDAHGSAFSCPQGVAVLSTHQ